MRYLAKKNIIALPFMLLAFLFQQASGQDSVTTRRIKTNIEQLTEKEGVAIKQEFIALGQAGATRIDFLRAEEITTRKELKAIRFTRTQNNGLEPYQQVSFIDSDQLDDLITFLNFARAITVKPDIYTEYHFKCRGNFEVFILSRQTNSGKLTGQWEYFVAVDRFDIPFRETLTRVEFSQFAEAIIKSKELFAKQ